jgi:DNA-binding response OmpR family regulator
MARILVIDDDRMVRDTLDILLTRAGHQPVLCADGALGLKAFAEIHPDLVITDILMPEKDGIETIRDLRRLDPGVPIVAMSGSGPAGDVNFLAAAGKLGADRTIAKPFEADLVLGTVAALLQRTPA